MDIAIVTGAESPLGIRIVERLVRQGCRVYGLGNNFSQTTFTHKDFIAIAVDITDLKATREAVEGIVNENGGVHLLIHALDVVPGTDFERLGVGNLEALINIGLSTPVLVTRLLLPNLIELRGQLLFVLSANKEGAAANAIAGLLESGLRRFARELLLRHRDQGLRVSTVLLRHNTAPGGNPAADGSSQTRIHPDHAADVIERMLNEGEPNIFGEMTLYPRCSPAASAQSAVLLPIDPYQKIQLPPKHKRVAEPEPIATRQAERPKAVFTISDEELEDRIAEAIEDYERDDIPSPDLRRDSRGPAPKKSQPQQPTIEKRTVETVPDNADSQAGAGDGQRKKKRSRGRSRRQRERSRREREQQDGGKGTPAESLELKAGSAPENVRPKPEQAVAVPASNEQPPPKKKTARKTATKTAIKKTATKKVANKTATQKVAKKVAKKKPVDKQEA